MPRRPKRSKSQDGAASKRKRDKDSDEEEDISSPSQPKPVVSVTDPSLLLYMEKLRAASDLSTLYATLKLTQEAIKTKLEQEEEYEEASDFLTPTDCELMEHAGTAVAFLMCKKAVELCTLPKSLGGLAFAQAKADNIVRQVFESLGVASCFDTTSEKDLAQACRENNIIEPQDLRKVLPKLKMIGMESRERIDQVRQELQAEKEDDLVVVQAYAV